MGTYQKIAPPKERAARKEMEKEPHSMAKETMEDSQAKDSGKAEKTTKEEKEEERTPKEEMDKEKAKQTRSRTRASTRIYEHPKTDPGVGVVEDNTSHQNVPTCGKGKPIH